MRRNLRAIERVRDTDDLRKKLIAELSRATGDGDALARELVSDDEKLTAARGRLADALRDLELAE